MTKRRFITQLPFTHQTPELRKFFSQTIDQVFQPGETQSINAFIGKKPSYYNAARDFYKTEITPERAFYQLEPAMTTTTAGDGTFDDLLFYPDVVNQLRFQGANTTNHSRLFNTDYYTWCPPVNIRKLDAYREYYWLPDGPPIMLFDIPVAGAYVTYQGDGFNKTFKIPYQVSGLNDGIIVEINGVHVPITSYDIVDGNVVLHSLTTTTPNVPAPGVNDTVLIIGNSSYRTNGILNSFLVPKIIPDSMEDIVVMINDEVIINGFVWDGNINDGLLADGNIPQGLIDGNIQVTYTITNGVLSFSSVIPAGNQVRIWMNANFKNNIVGKDTYMYPVSAIVYALETITEQYSDPVNPSSILTRQVLKKYPEKTLPLPPALVQDMRIQINDNTGLNTYQVNIRDGLIQLQFVEELIAVQQHDPMFILIERNATNENEWSTRNHWYHRDVLLYGDATYQPVQATRPILEYFNNVQLFNYGAYLRDPVDLVLDDTDIALINPSSDGYTYDVNMVYDGTKRYDTVLVEGLLDSDLTIPPVVRDPIAEAALGVAHLPLIHGTYIKSGTRILVTDNYDPAIKNNIAVARTFTVSTPYDPDETATVTNFDVDNLWDSVEMLTFDIEQTHALDQVKLNGTTKQYWSTGETWKEISYFVGQEPLFDLFDRNGISLANATTYPAAAFLGSKIFTYERDTTSSIDSVLNLRVTRNKYGLIEFRDHLATDVWNYGANTVQGYTYFGMSAITNDIAHLTKRNNWYNAGTTSQTVNADGLYSIPSNLQANPANKEIEVIAPNDWKAQFNQLIAGSNWNLSSDQFDLSLGSHIIQSRGTMLKTMLLCSDTNLDFVKASIYNEHEYTRYRNKLVNLLKQYEIQTGLDDIPTALTDVMKQLKSAKTSDFPFFNNGIIGEYFIPATAAYLGMTALWKPELILEVGRTGSIILIRGHDGSITPGASRFNTKTITMSQDSVGNYTLVDSTITDPAAQPTVDAKDIALLTFERQYYASTIVDLQTQRRPVFDLKTFTPGKFRETEYSRDEFLAIARPIFERWASKTSLKYRANTIYDDGNHFTWNYSNLLDIDGNEVPGFWRGMYRYYFDTDRPHTHPWEMLGFTSKPQWWDGAYSWTDATKRQNLINALMVGLVSSPMTDAVYDATFARGPVIDPVTQEIVRHGIDSFIPVDDQGVLLTPFQAGIVVEDAFQSYNGDWEFGDLAPVEYQWRSGVSNSFIEAQMSYLMKPVKFLESNWETADEIEVNGYDWVSKKTGRRTQISDYRIHNELVNNVAERVLGLQTWLSDYLRSTGKDVTAYLGDRVRGLGVNLAHKLGGFADAASLNTFTENTGLIPQEDVKTVTYNSPSIREEFYGGVIVQWTGRGWKVLGYDVVDPAFKILPVDENGKKARVALDGVVETTVNDWHQNTYYQVSVVILHAGNTYRCIKTHTSAKAFEQQFWEVDNSINHNEVTTLLFHGDHFNEVERVPYNTEFYSKQDVANFLSGYQAYLESRGWVFDQYDSNQNTILDWKFATKEFLSWTQVRWSPNTFIALSPAANQLKFAASHGAIQNVEQLVNGVYSLLGKEGQAIEKRNVTADRSDDGITVSVVNDAIYGLRLSINEVEQAIVFHNKTIFNDVIYEPLFDVRQNRLRIITLLTTQWTGKLDAPGFIISNNQVLPSFEKQVEDIRNMYDIEKTIVLPLRENAQHQIGYQNRPYLEQLMYNEVNQFEFYQGMIQQKGAPGVFTKLMRNDELTQSRNLSFLEEWAFRTGEFGGTDINSFFEIELPRADIQQDPQLVVFRQADSYWDLGDFDSEPNNGIIVSDDASYQANKSTEYLKCFEYGIPTNVDPTKLSSMDPDDAVVEMVSIKNVYDSRIIMPYSGNTPFIFDKSFMPKKGGMPTAGYVRTDEANWMAPTIAAFNEQVLASPANLTLAQRVWIYDTGLGDWNVFRASNANNDLPNKVVSIHPAQTGIKVVFEQSHNYAIGELIDFNDKISSINPATVMSLVSGENAIIVSGNITSAKVFAPGSRPTARKINSITAIYPDENGIKVVFAQPHNLIKGDTVYFNKLIAAVKGPAGLNVVNVTSVEDQTLDAYTIIVDGDIISKHEYINEDQPAVLKLFSVRQSVTDHTIIESSAVDLNIMLAAGIVLPTGGFQPNELLYVDLAPSVAINAASDVQRWRVFIWDSLTGKFQKYRTQPQRVRSDLIRDVRVFDTTPTRTSRTLNAYPLLNQDILVYDPIQGLIPGVANKEITYQLEDDPAFYNVGTDVDEVGFDWGNEQVGQLWWDMSTTRFLEYTTDDTMDDSTRITQLHSAIELAKIQFANRVAVVESQYDAVYRQARLPLEAKITAYQISNNQSDTTNDVAALSYLESVHDSDYLAFKAFEEAPYLIFNHSRDWNATEYLKRINDSSYIELISLQNQVVDRQSEIDREMKYRKDNWGAIAPNSSIDIYEWIKSDIAPSDWATAVAAGTNPEVYDGIVLNADDPKWVETTEWNEQLGEDVTVYFFWVKGRKTIPAQKDFREMSAASVASIITNPADAGLAWVAPIADDAFIVTGVLESLNTTSSIQFKVAMVDSDVPRHVEWEIMREGDERSVPTLALWDKLTQSLTGRDHKGNTLPSANRYVTDRIGFDVEHGQSLFSNVTNARKHLVQYLNNLFASVLIVDERRDLTVLNASDTDEQVLQWYQKQDSYYHQPLPDARLYDRVFDTQDDYVAFINANPTNLNTVGLVARTSREDAFWSIMSAVSSTPQYNNDGTVIPDPSTLDTLWDIVVADMTELNALMPTVGLNQKVKVTGSPATGGFDTIWRVNSTRTEFKLVTTQQFQATDIFEYVDWYSSGYSTANPPILSFENTIVRDEQLGTSPSTTFVKILDDGKGRWAWMQYTNGMWLTVAKQNGTIQLIDAVWKNTGNYLPAFTTLPSDFATQVANRDMGYELSAFLNGMRDYILTSMELNNMFFSMVSYAHTEQSSIDWCFKTSFMYVTGYTEKLLQDPVAYVDRTSNLLEYINEVKPYHVKVRDFISKYGIQDTANTKVTDFDLPVYYDPRLGKFRTLNPNSNTDIAIMKTGVWNDWYQQYLRNDNQFARKINVTIGRYDFNDTSAQIINETAKLSVAESIRVRIFRRGDVGASSTRSQLQTSALGVSLNLDQVMPEASSIAVFADGLRVDPAVVTFDPFKSTVRTPASSGLAVLDGNLVDGMIVDSLNPNDAVDGNNDDPYNKTFNYEVASFGYGSTGVIRDIKYFRKTATTSSFDLGHGNTDVTVSQLKVTVNGMPVTPTVTNGVVTVSDALADGLVQIAILDKTTSRFNVVTTHRFDAAAIGNNSLAELYPELTNPTRWPMMNNFVIEIDGYRVAPEMFYQVNINSSNRMVRMEREADVNTLDVRFDGIPVQVGTNLVRRVTINGQEREANLGQGVALNAIRVTDLTNNPLIVGALTPNYSVDPEHPTLITSSMVTPSNADFVLSAGHLIKVGPMTANMDVLVEIDGYIPDDLTLYSWTPASARFVQVNDAIVSVEREDNGVLTISDRAMGQIGLYAPIRDTFDASLVTITDFQSAETMGARTWTFRADQNDFFPINGAPINDDAVWINLNGRRLRNGIDYEIVEVSRPTWNRFTWDKETWDSLDRANQGNLITADESFDSEEWDPLGKYDTLPFEKMPNGVDILWDEYSNYDMGDDTNWGIKLLVDTNLDDLIVATVFSKPQSTYARVWELFLKEKVDQLFDSTNFDYEAWDHEEDYTVVREITLKDRYELTANVAREATTYTIRQAPGPFTRDTIEALDIENKLWLDKEYVVVSQLQPGADAVVTSTRGDAITSKLAHNTTIEVFAPRIVGPESHYMPL